MKTVTAVLSGLVLALTLAACGGGDSGSGGDARSEVRKELQDLGLSKSLTNCAIKEIEKDAGSLEKFAELDASEQQTVAAEAGSKCASGASKDEVGDLAKGLEKQDVDLSDPAFRKSFITGMTSQGVPEALATCIADKAGAEDLKASQLVDEATIQRLAKACQ
ncbi:hypothetical protein [Aeromicrobium sp. NPDC092404]|uniref:hypothetical protein n=1 Tax=Aeromicrobium sp. NPDC092404 TaxID=3154976 RepID=UPI00341C62E6